MTAYVIVHQHAHGPKYYRTPSGAYFHGEIGRERAERFTDRSGAEMKVRQMFRTLTDGKSVEAIA